MIMLFDVREITVRVFSIRKCTIQQSLGADVMSRAISPVVHPMVSMMTPTHRRKIYLDH